MTDWLTGLRLFMPMDEGAGDPKDFSSYGNHGTRTGASWVAGKYGQSLSFNGSSDKVNVPAAVSGLPIGNADRTLMAWVNVTDYAAHRTIVGYGEAVANKMCQFYVTQTNGYLALAFSNNDHVSTIVVPSGAWHHVAAVLYEEVKSKLYLDAGSPSTKTDHAAINTTDSDVRIGTRIDDALWWKGLIDEVRLYNRALTQGEIQEAMGAVTSGLRYWRKTR